MGRLEAGPFMPETEMGYRTQMDGQFALDRPLTVEHKVTLEKFADERHDPPGRNRMPDDYWCNWRPNEMGTAIEQADGDFSFYHYTEWLKYLIETFLVPWGYVLNGRVDWSGEEPNDIGAIFVRDNVVRAVEAEIVIRNPFDAQGT